MGVSLKTENEELCVKDCADKGRRRRAARFHRHLHGAFRWQVPRKPSARLTHGLKLVTAVWPLRCSVLSETPMASAIHFRKLNCYTERRAAKVFNVCLAPRPGYRLPCTFYLPQFGNCCIDALER